MSKWKMVRLGEVLDYEQPTKYIVESTDYNDCYCTPVLTAGQTFILGYTDESDNVFKDNLPVIIFDDFTTAIKYVNFPFKVKSSAMKILKAKKEIAHIKYLFYCMSIIKVDTQLHKRYWISKYTNIEIPLPPIEEQKRIADILDKASSLIDLRKQQLEKMDLLIKSKFIDMFGDPVTNPKGWEVKNLKDIALGKLSYGSGASATEYDFNVRYIRITDINEKGSLNALKVSPNEISNEYILSEGDILFARSGATVGKTFRYSEKYGKCIYAGYLIRLVPNQKKVLPDYIYYLTRTDYYLFFVQQSMKTVAQPNINAQQYGALQISIPPISIQNQFAEFVEQVEQQKAVMQKSLEKMETNYKALMQEYFE